MLILEVEMKMKYKTRRFYGLLVERVLGPIVLTMGVLFLIDILVILITGSLTGFWNSIFLPLGGTALFFAVLLLITAMIADGIGL